MRPARQGLPHTDYPGMETDSVGYTASVRGNWYWDLGFLTFCPGLLLYTEPPLTGRNSRDTPLAFKKNFLDETEVE